MWGEYRIRRIPGDGKVTIEHSERVIYLWGIEAPLGSYSSIDIPTMEGADSGPTYRLRLFMQTVGAEVLTLNYTLAQI